MNAGCPADYTRADVPPSPLQSRVLPETPSIITCCNLLHVLHGLKRLKLLSLKSPRVRAALGRHSSEILLSQGHHRGMSGINLVRVSAIC